MEIAIAKYTKQPGINAITEKMEKLDTLLLATISLRTGKQ